jgi:thymidylate synthase (FAD)
MVIVSPSVKIETEIDTEKIYKFLELCGRNAYKSEDKITQESAEKFLRMLISRGHESVLEHFSVTVRIVCDRGVSHQLVRHRIASYTQESTRYTSSNPMQVIKPYWYDIDLAAGIRWANTMKILEDTYAYLRTEHNLAPQDARAVLPLSLKTEVIATMNLREWRHVLRIRTAPDAHPHIRFLMLALLKQFKECLPILFEDIEV